MATTQPQIRVKSYFATTLTDAIELARKELGPDALLLSSRQAPPEAGHKGLLEVVFGESTDLRTDVRRPASEAPAPQTAPGIDDLRQKMEEIHNLLLRGGAAPPAANARKRVVEQVLFEAGLTRGLAAEIENAVASRINRRSVTDISRPRPTRELVADLILQETSLELSERLQVKPEIGRVTALVGPPGSGKTTTLVKLAVREGLAKGRPVRLISADWHRIAASEQLRIYAAILGVPFQGVDTISALTQAIDSAPSNATLLIDTPGLSPALLESSGGGLAAFLRQRQDVDTHLVLTASMRQIDMERAANRFADFRYCALIFTRLDETDSSAAIFCEAARTRKPVSFLCHGQVIPENIEAASKDSLTESLVRHLPQRLRSAA